MADDRTRDGAVLDPPRLFGPRAWYRRREESPQAGAVVDELTGLRNQRALWRELSRRASACSESSPVAVVMVDLDLLDDVNERYGHEVGDAVLRRAAAVVREVAPSPRLAFRYGGEEFVLLVAGDQEHGRAIGEQVRAEIAARNGELPAVTASCGVAALEGPVEPWVALDRADAALRGAKRAGRDRVVVAGANAQTADAYLVGAVEHEAPRRAALALAVASATVRDQDDRPATEDVLTLCTAIGRRLGLEGAELDRLLAAAQLHDVGKVAVPPEIFNKPGPLTDDERAIVGEHTVTGEGILRSVPEMAEVATIVRHSHERWDGSGYPDGLAGEQIPLASRVILCADAFQAIRSDRPYRAGRSAADAIAELRACAGTQFDPAVVHALVEVADRVRAQEADPGVVTALPRSRRLAALLLALTLSTGTAFAAIPEVRDLVQSLLGTTPPVNDIVEDSSGAGGFSFGPLGDMLSLEPVRERGKKGEPGSPAAPAVVPLALAVRNAAAKGEPPGPRPVFEPDVPRGAPPSAGPTPPARSPDPPAAPPRPGPKPPGGNGQPGPAPGPGPAPSPGPQANPPQQDAGPAPGPGNGPAADPPRGSDPAPGPGPTDPAPGPGPDPDPGPGTDPPPPGRDTPPRRPEQSPARNDEAREDGAPGRPENPGRTDPPRNSG